MDNNIGNVIVGSLYDVWDRFINYVPQIIGAIVLIIIGLLLGALVGGIIKKVLNAVGIDRFLQKTGILEKIHMQDKISISGFIGSLVRWIIILSFLVTAMDALALPQISELLNSLIRYIPNIIAAALIITIGFIASDYVAHSVEGFVQASAGPGRKKRLLGNIVRYTTIVFATMAALMQLMIAPTLIAILFAGLVLTAALAFGLGGRDQASRMLEGINEK